MTTQELEQELCTLFAELLGIPEVDPADSFFDLGGHSLLASRLARRIHTVYGTRTPIRRIYSAPTAESLARYLSASALAEGA
ncbi:acyl carrier protein [Peterkaempfera sp. SMS 1(5)a]|uniref:acyl carrier protein n=1 Tax=Peterkaempfera podocarpi TaxID=3232308 RepID=UPI00366FEE96